MTPLTKTPICRWPAPLAASLLYVLSCFVGRRTESGWRLLIPLLLSVVNSSLRVRTSSDFNLRRAFVPGGAKAIQRLHCIHYRNRHSFLLFSFILILFWQQWTHYYNTRLKHFTYPNFHNTYKNYIFWKSSIKYFEIAIKTSKIIL